ncbi:MAG TPA: NmrA family NAD(P)-binding protein [Dongiaceae bacterium]|nr:NmrA family NAD(P)-binding protein [Dongiaceae bacterium]
MFSVMGVTGKVGGAAAASLLQAGAVVKAIVREPGKGIHWQKRGAAVAVADLDDAAALARAFAGADGAFVMLPPLFDPSPDFAEARRMSETLRAALAAARPGKVVCLSTIGADAGERNLLSQLGLLERTLGDLPMPVAFLRAAWFLENATWDVAPACATGILASPLQPLDKPFPMVATADVGRAAAALLREEWTGRRIVELEGPRRVSPDAIAAALGEALGRPVRAQVVARETWETLFHSQGMRNPGPRMRMLDGFNEGWIEFADAGARARKGRVALPEVIRALVAAAQASAA